ncbi:MAG: alanine--glyoxylate aminotransferase family protein [candidate division WOR-3 bacterium]|nr:alanine--glyoxylate aminotransferase family protein [candidate division WOR-3 bacterium]
MPKKYTLFTPGPTEVPDYIYQVMSEPLVYHREQAFAELFDSVGERIKKLLKTKNPVYFLTASGTGAMESAVSNLVSYRERVVIAACGKFGQRWNELCIRYGAYIDDLSVPYGKSVPPEELERRLRTDDAARYVFTTLTETSTGALQDMKAFGEICRRNNRILIVDAVAGLGADKLKMDEWNIDVVCGASQKALFCPPGLSFIAVNERAWEIMQKTRSPRYYFDLKLYKQFAEKGQTPWTPAISLFFALDCALERILKTGVEKVWEKHRLLAESLRAKLSKLGLEFMPEKPSNALTVIKMPEGINGTQIVEIAKTKKKILFANGQAEMRGKIVRIGHMGAFSRSDINRAFSVFKDAYTQVKKKRKVR